MPLWIVIIVSVYAVVALGFIIAMYVEAPKHRAKVNLGHYLVALAWPGWALWYVRTLVKEKWNV